jgi:hypothetical protein
MSQENVELVRSIRTAWEGGDYSSVAWAHPEIEFVIADGPAPGRWTGLAGLAAAFSPSAAAAARLGDPSDFPLTTAARQR